MKSIELMKKALTENDDELTEKLKAQENWSDDEIMDVLADICEDAIKIKEKMGLQWMPEELEEMLGDDGYWD